MILTMKHFRFAWLKVVKIVAIKIKIRHKMCVKIKQKDEPMKKIQQIILAFMLGIMPIQSVWADSKVDELKLVIATLDGDLKQVKTLIKQGVDINAKSIMGGTALMAASFDGHLEVVKYLISNGADVNAGRTNSGVTALMDASANGHLEIVKYLISKGADINAVVTIETKGVVIDNITALMLASSRGHLEIVQYLISKGADVNVVAVASEKTEGIVNNFTALDSATKNEHYKIVEVLKSAVAKHAKEIEK